MSSQASSIWNASPGQVNVPGSTGMGGIWNDLFQPSIAAGTQGQASGGFNTSFGTSLFGDPNSTNMSIPGGSNFFPANGASINPSQLGNFASTTPIPGGATSNSGHGLTAIGQPVNMGKQLSKIYGTDIGGLLQAFLNSGAGFNPSVVAAQQNAAMPLEARGRANIMDAFGAHGLANSSSAAIGLGDFESQFNLGLQDMFAKEYEQSVQNYLNVLTGTKEDAKQQNAQRGGPLSFLTNLLPVLGPLFGQVPFGSGSKDSGNSSGSGILQLIAALGAG